MNFPIIPVVIPIIIIIIIIIINPFIASIRWYCKIAFNFLIADFPNETKTETTEPIWLPADLKVQPNEIVDVNFDESCKGRPRKNLNEVQTRQIPFC